MNKMGTVEKIMLIDDDADEYVLFKEAVSRVRKDVEVCYASGVVDAFTLLESIKGNLPDLIFLDINMPMHNGRDCLKALRQSKRFAHIPVVMYTVQDLLNEEKDELRTLGASFFLQKPELKDLILILTFLLGGRQSTADIKDVAKLFVKLA
jgi:CheY-like chemotaxis protein